MPLPPQWPGIPNNVVPPNAGLKLFGGAAFERCLNEFQEAAHALKFPASEWGQEGGCMCRGRAAAHGAEVEGAGQGTAQQV